MWRNLTRQASLKKLKSSDESCSFLSSYSSLKFYQDSNFTEKIRPSETQTHVNYEYSVVGFPQRRGLFSQKEEMGMCNLSCFSNPFSFSGLYGYARAYGSVAEAIDSTEEEDSDEIQELIEEMNRVSNLESNVQQAKQPKLVGGMGEGKYHMLRRRQIKMETEAWEEAAKEYQELLMDMCEQKLAPNLPYMKSLFLGWFEPLRNAIAAEQEMCKEGKNRTAYAPYFDHLPADMMAVIVMHKLMGLLMTGGADGSARVVQAACQIGEAIEHENGPSQVFPMRMRLEGPWRVKALGEPWCCRVGELGSVTPTYLPSSMGDCLSFISFPDQARIHSFLEKTKKKNILNQNPEEGSDTVGKEQQKLRKKVTILMKKQKVQQVRQIVKRHEDIKPWGQDAQVKARHMVIPYMPMLVPPLNWAGYDRGAYLFLPSYIMRTHGAKQQRDAVKRTPKKQLEPVFEALNTLGSTKWRVNKRVLGIIDRIWASGGRLADLVDREDVPLPEEIDTEDEAEIRKWKWKVKSVKKENSERHSQRCDIELKLAVARKMKDENGFFYPHNLDFRGRAYPMHPYLNHLGSDLCRGILEFAEGRPLGKCGLQWLKIHMANLYAGGVDKFSYEGRIAFTENHLDDIFDSADRPLEGRRWWLGAEDPFQCLATCINLAEALRSSSPETTISYMPVHQDGSCNGLQHYAALGRDKLGAAAVNLVAGEKPADVYSGIAARVLDIMRRDAEKDPATDPNASRARLLINQVDRKLVKQTVMTSVYGVTYIGARDQIKKRLKDRCAIEDDDELFAASCYAAKTTLTALGEMFEAARSIMSWLGDCAKIIASENHPVRWTTPLGLPVVQPYRKLGRHLVMVKRQRTAFPPNFVHSLDGSHMMMTAVACKEAGLNFAGVHDSYWTHACDVDQMNRILREKFVELYEAPILENMLNSKTLRGAVKDLTCYVGLSAKSRAFASTFLCGLALRHEPKPTCGIRVKMELPCGVVLLDKALKTGEIFNTRFVDELWRA
ncbi:hypothetical protein TEA_015539 [Camellia sinensis var. sinensis]|uniref:DNA-directed RNA polymerase n=1 Tax=Camellia sinensis var. sinensis TaxID=542762 RepID=A0A4S4CYD9_CAMSN|nr:hypothetical protein TEA_015539 [Camellia sinensis var. sinensis]